MDDVETVLASFCLFFIVLLVPAGCVYSCCNSKTDNEKIETIIQKQTKSVEYYHSRYLEELEKLNKMKMIVSKDKEE